MRKSSGEMMDKLEEYFHQLLSVPLVKVVPSLKSKDLSVTKELLANNGYSIDLTHEQQVAFLFLEHTAALTRVFNEDISDPNNQMEGLILSTLRERVDPMVISQLNTYFDNQI